MASDVSYTYEDYARLPEGAPVQLIGGQLVVSPSPSLAHQRILGRLFRWMAGWVDAHRLGEVFIAPVDLILGPEDVYQPDLIFLASGHEDWLCAHAIEGPADLVVEILSPSTASYDLRQKKTAYGRLGVREYWIVDPNTLEVDVFVRDAGVYHVFDRGVGTGSVRSQVLDGWGIELEPLFAG